MTAPPALPPNLADRLPLVIGITGHRDPRPQDAETLRLHVRAVLKGVRRDYLHDSPETPIVVLSALAEGADRIAAEAALEEGAVLVAPLPMPRDEYLRDFEPGHGLAPDAVAEFDRLCALALATPEMPFAAGNSLAAVRAEDDSRARQYREVGLYIARHSHVLLALWNGDDTRKPGGTADVVACKREGIPLGESHAARAALDGSEIGPVVHVVTPRVGQGGIEVETRPWGLAVAGTARQSFLAYCWTGARAFVVSLFGGHARAGAEEAGHVAQDVRTWEVFGAIAELTARFNREAATLHRAPDGAARLETSRAQLFTPPGADAAIDAARQRTETVAPRWCNLYTYADALARLRQAQFRTDWKYLFALGFAAIMFFETFGHLSHESSWLLALYIAVFAVVFGWFLWAAWAEHQERFLDYRAFAEVLRIAAYWKLLGVRRNVAETYPIKQSDELAWVKITLRTLEMLDGTAPARTGPGLDPQAERWVRSLWVDGQRAYFHRQGEKYNATAERFERSSFVFALISPLIAAILIGIDIHYGHDAAHDSEAFEWLRRGLIFVIGMSAALAATWAGFNEKLAFKAQARQYDRMGALFARAIELLESPTAAPHAEALYCELGAEAMKDTAEWVAIYRQRPIRPASA